MTKRIGRRQAPGVRPCPLRDPRCQATTATRSRRRLSAAPVMPNPASISAHADGSGMAAATSLSMMLSMNIAFALACAPLKRQPIYQFIATIKPVEIQILDHSFVGEET